MNKRLFKHTLAVILSLTMLAASTLSVFAADKAGDYIPASSAEGNLKFVYAPDGSSVIELTSTTTLVFDVDFEDGTDWGSVDIDYSLNFDGKEVPTVWVKDMNDSSFTGSSGLKNTGDSFSRKNLPVNASKPLGWIKGICKLRIRFYVPDGAKLYVKGFRINR